MKNRYVIVAHQRTGTHFLGAMLRKSPSIFQYDEVLLPIFEGKFGESGLFFPYFRKLVDRDPASLLLTDYTQVDKVFRGFFEHLEQGVEEPIMGADLKIDQIAAFPRLHWILPTWGFKIIHVVRQNYLARVLSHTVMNRRMAEGEDLHFGKQASQPVELPVDATIRWMQADQGGNAYVQATMSHGEYKQVAYEDLASDKKAQVMSDLFEFLGAEPPDDLMVGNVKQSDRPLSELISNYSEMIAEIDRRGLSKTFGLDA